MSKETKSLDAWLSQLEARHPTEIDMGLTRISKVRDLVGTQFNCPVIMVAGTNGKGSTCAMLESILRHAGYRVGLYSKPHFLNFNERARINGESATDDEVISAFERVESYRGNVSLTYFEFTTLAICDLLSSKNLDVVILEVGLGGRLDAVNIFDADVSIVTSIDIDHSDYLGTTREQIAYEKACIFRSGKTAICSDPQTPKSLIDHAESIGANLWLLGASFSFQGDKQQWTYLGKEQRRGGLPYPGLRGANQLLNAAGVLACIESLRDLLPVSAQDIRTGLVTVELPGRFQVIPGKPQIILDVAHNPHAAATLAQNLSNMGYYPYTHAVFGCMSDKDVSGIVSHLKDIVDHWHVCTLPLPRSSKSFDLKKILIDQQVLSDHEKTISEHDSPEEAFNFAMRNTTENDRIIVFGSFLTVAGAMRVRASK